MLSPLKISEITSFLPTVRDGEAKKISSLKGEDVISAEDFRDNIIFANRSRW
jgi:hypothetical protein